MPSNPNKSLQTFERRRINKLVAATFALAVAVKPFSVPAPSDFNRPFLVFVLVVIGGIWLLMTIRVGLETRSFITRGQLLVGAFLFWAVASTAVGVVRGSVELTNLPRALAPYLPLVLYMVTPRPVVCDWRVKGALVFSGLVYMLIEIVGLLQEPYLSRVTLYDPRVWVPIPLLLIPLAINFGFEERWPTNYLTMAAATSLVGAWAVFQATRTMVAGVLVAFFVSIICVMASRGYRSRIVLVGLTVLLAATVIVRLAVLSFPLGGLERLFSLSDNGRLTEYREGVAKWTQDPVTVLAGYGAGSSIRVAGETQTYFHSAILTMAVHHGLLGVLLYASLHVKLLTRAWRNRFLSSRTRGFVVSSIVTFLFVSQFFAYIRNMEYWLVLSLLGAISDVTPSFRSPRE